MARKLTSRQYLLSILALRYDLSQKELGARAGMSFSRVSQHLRRQREGEIKDDVFQQLLAAVPCPPAAVPIVTACLEALDALESDGDLTPAEQAEIEEGILAATRKMRATLVEAAGLSREAPAAGAYPEPRDLAPARQKADELFAKLEGLSPDMRLMVLDAAEELQTWALCERVCQGSAQEASRDLNVSAAWAQFAQEIAEGLRGPEGWRIRIQGYAAAHGANVLRVSGELEAAETRFEVAKRLWHSGSDPGEVLDPGRLLDLESSLRRDQRRFEEAVALLQQAEVTSRFPGRVLIKKGFTLEAMGEYERAVAALLEAEPVVERQGDVRLGYMRRFNLAVNYCHLGLYDEATELVQAVRELAAGRGDENELSRVTWLEGRIAAGRGRPTEARRLLARARQAFCRRRMSYDVALALLEEAALLLAEGRTGEAKTLAEELTIVFKSKGVHREALSALGLFQEAVMREEATAGLARRVLRFLFRARYDPGLRFES